MAEQHPIQGLMYTAMQSIRDMIDVNTIVGDAVQTPDGTVIIPISKVGLGFGVGGSDHTPQNAVKAADGSSANLFGGGAGGGVSITPVAFMVVGNGQIRLMPVSPETNIYDRLLDLIPAAIDKIADGVSAIRKTGGEKSDAEDKMPSVNTDFSEPENDTDISD